MGSWEAHRWTDSHTSQISTAHASLLFRQDVERRLGKPKQKRIKMTQTATKTSQNDPRDGSSTEACPSMLERHGTQAKKRPAHQNIALRHN